MSTDIALENPVEAKVVDYGPSESDKEEEEEPDPFVLFRILLNGHEVLEEFEDMTDEIFYIKKQFESISTMLTVIDAMKFLSYKKAVRPMFAPLWVPLYGVRIPMHLHLINHLTSTPILVNSIILTSFPSCANPQRQTLG